MSSVKFTDNSDLVKKQLEVVIGSVLYQIGKDVTDTAKKIVPVDTGNLRDSITHEENLSEKSTYIGVPAGKADYGKFVEFGTYKMRAQPFLRPAVEAELPKIKKMCESSLKGTGLTGASATVSGGSYTPTKY